MSNENTKPASALTVMHQALTALENCKPRQEAIDESPDGSAWAQYHAAQRALREQIERMTPSPELLAAVRQASAAGLPFAEHEGEVVFINRGDSEDQHVEHEDLSCPHCGGSGHKDDVKMIGLDVKDKRRDLLECAIDGALTSGYQGVAPAPEGHWLERWWQQGRRVAEREQALESDMQRIDHRALELALSVLGVAAEPPHILAATPGRWVQTLVAAVLRTRDDLRAARAAAPAAAPVAPQPQTEAYLWRNTIDGSTRVVRPDSVITADATWEVVGPLVLAGAPVAQPQPAAWVNAAQAKLLASGAREWIMAWNAPGKVSGEPSDLPVALAFTDADPVAQPQPLTNEQIKDLYVKKHWYEMGEFTWGAASVVVRAVEQAHGIGAGAKATGGAAA